MDGHGDSPGAASEQHGDPLWHAGANQVPRGGAPTVVEQPVRHARLPTRISQGVAPHAHGHAISAKHERVTRPLSTSATRED